MSQSEKMVITFQKQTWAFSCLFQKPNLNTIIIWISIIKQSKENTFVELIGVLCVMTWNTYLV